jgi:hypothetical protein
VKQLSRKPKLKKGTFKRTLRSPDFINCGKQREKLQMNNKSNWNIKPKETRANNQEELISNWPWEYPAYIKASNKEGEWTSTNRFLGLIVCMNQVYINHRGDVLKKDGLVSHTDRSLKNESRNYPKKYKPSYFQKCGTKARIHCGNACREQQNKAGTTII